MSLIKFVRCRHLIFDRRDTGAFNLRRRVTAFSTTPPHKKPVMLLSQLYSKTTKIKHFPSHVSPNHFTPDCLLMSLYATSIKPHMTASMQKWKQKKRKSKPQQKREMDKLHADLVKLLTKRAVELVKNKSALEAQQGLVSTHVFTSFPILDGLEGPFSGLRSAEALGGNLSTLRPKSSFIAEAVEVELRRTKTLSTGSDNLSPASRALHSLPGVTNDSKMDVTVSGNIEHTPGSYKWHPSNNPPEKPIPAKTSPGSVPNKVSATTKHQSTTRFDSSHLGKSSDSVVRQSSPHLEEISQNHNPSFLQDLAKFKMELTTALNKDTTNDTSFSSYDWDVVNSLNDDIDLHSVDEVSEQKCMRDVPEGEVSSLNGEINPILPGFSKSILNSSSVISKDYTNSVRPEIKTPDLLSATLNPSVLLPVLDQSSETCTESSTNQIDDLGTLKQFSDTDFVDHHSAVILENLELSDVDVATLTEENILFEKTDLTERVIENKQLQHKKVEKVKLLQTVKVDDKMKKPNPASKQNSKHKDASHHKPHSLNVNKDLEDLAFMSFVNVSCLTNSEMVAVRNLQLHAARHKLPSINVFNKLCHSLAKKQDLKTIKSFFKTFRNQDLAPTLQTYAGCLECIGRMPQPDLQTCRKLLADISSKGFDLKDIANECSFELDEWDYVLKAIKLVDPEFLPNPPRLKYNYDNKLVHRLNVPNEEKIEKNQYALDLNATDLYDKAIAQLEMEKQGQVTVESIQACHGQPVNMKLKNMRNRLLEEWRASLLGSFERKLQAEKKKASDSTFMTIYPYLRLFPPEEYVGIIFKFLKEIFTLSENYSPCMVIMQLNLGGAVNKKYDVMSKVKAGMGDRMINLYKQYIQNYTDSNFELDNHRLMWQKAMNQNYDTINMDMSFKKWPSFIRIQVGKFLLGMILYDLKVNANLFRPKSPVRRVPAFCTIFRPDVSFNTNSEIKMHPVLAKLFSFENIDSFTFDPSIVPMIVPPVPWISRNLGGLLLGSNSLVRQGNDIDVLKLVPASRYPAVLDSLNTLSACAWKINKPILDLQIQIFNNKGDSKLKVAPPASELPPLPPVTQEMTSRDKAMVFRERMALQQQRQDMHGLWCTDLYRLSIAHKFRDQIFWFPHSMDFRGRTYPLPPHFNHLGSDNVRGMLLFSKGKPLGENGYNWLKIHLVNLTGFKKRCSNAERLEYANAMMNEILDSADNPLEGNKWWQSSDEPWQTLACCMEIAKIERFQGEKQDYVCHFPVHQDGSCNGLQHYAALGRDQAGAESVNLCPFDTPQDVYSDVVDLVEKTRKKHAEEGSEVAKALEGLVKRKVIKQTIMTTVYGVTKFGAKLQIHRQLKDIPDLPPDLAWKASLYLADTTFSCLREMFSATKDIQDWLTESAKLISTVVPVEWVTPLGFLIIQPYYKKLNKAESKHDKFKPNVMKQKNAFPPNYIHSLDSTHMMLTSLFCMHAGITFVSVHDCYWTHACDVPIMNKICREQFVNMHKQPLLEDLSDHLISVVNRAIQDPHLEAEKKMNVPLLIDLLSKVPKRGTFELDNVLKSTYFFS